MMHVLISVVALAALFAVYGLLQRGRKRPGCHDCVCRGGVCERTGEPRHLELVETNDVRS